MPDLTRDRGAGTRQAPYRQASHISSQLASKATDRPAITRSPGLIGLSCRNIRASASTKAAALRWLTATPFGVPVEPEVKITHASSVRSGSSSGAGDGGILGREDDEVGGHDRGDPRLVEHEAGPLVGVVVVDGHVRRAREQDADDGHVEVGRAGRDAHPDPVAAPDALVAQGGRHVCRGGQQLVVGEHLAAVVDGRRVGVVVGGGAQDVDERARCRGAISAKQRVRARPGDLHGAHHGGPVDRGSDRPAQQAAAAGVDQAHEDHADEDDHLDAGTRRRGRGHG